MTEEINEIIKYLKNDNIEKPFGMATIDKKRLLGYITNLQKENEKLKEKINKLEDCKQRNEKAVEYNYKLQEKTSHQALFDEPLASEIYSIAENNINILQGGDE